MSEYTWTDSDGNGTYDTGYADTDGNGYWDLAASDVSGNGVIDAYQYDPNGNGVVGDEVRFDLDENGVTDLVSYDHDENGIADAFAAETTGWQAVAAAPANAPATTAIAPFGPTVMPMQGAYWSGVQGESLQMTFTRLLQTETDPFTQVQLANAIALGNIHDMYDPWTY